MRSVERMRQVDRSEGAGGIWRAGWARGVAWGGMWCLVIEAAGVGRGVAAGVADLPALTEAQRVQLATADPRRAPDEPAWYGLLGNVASWDGAALAGVREQLEAEWAAGRSGVAGQVDGAGMGARGWRERLDAEASAWRGRLVWVQGRYVGRVRRGGVLRAGPWGEALTEWGVELSAVVGLEEIGGGGGLRVQGEIDRRATATGKGPVVRRAGEAGNG